jgi:hypothetical protein
MFRQDDAAEGCFTFPVAAGSQQSPKEFLGARFFSTVIQLDTAGLDWILSSLLVAAMHLNSLLFTAMS